MNLTKLELLDFKKVNKVEINLSPLNILVGGNNAGKSSVLQGIHFSVAAAIASRIAEKDTYPQDSLLYCPAHNFENLRHGAPYRNQANFSFLTIKAEFPGDDKETSHIIRVYRGRNEGNVGCIRSTEKGGQVGLGLAVSNSDKLFSIYVPGLAGIPQSEQFRTESVIRRGVASGDANMYLRNVLLQIKNKGLLDDLHKKMRSLFDKFYLFISFDPKRDIYIDVQVSVTGVIGRKCPIELIGTGVLQALQIFSYVTLYEPRLILLDEPDSHLHPDNQSLLAETLRLIAEDTTTKVIISTHSRHLVDALYENANFVWLKEGKVSQQGVALDVLPMLLDIGALDNYDRLKGGKIKNVFLTEDRKMELVKLLAEGSNFDLKETLFFSYKTSTNLESAIMLAEFMKDIAPDTRVIVHRDADFMIEQEVEKVRKRIVDTGAECFITEGSDIEAYFVEREHLGELLGVDFSEIDNWLDELALENHNDLSITYSRKRDEIKHLLYRKNPDDCPKTSALMGKGVPLSVDKRKGKDMIKLVRANMKGRFGKVVDVVAVTSYLYSHFLIDLPK